MKLTKLQRDAIRLARWWTCAETTDNLTGLHDKAIAIEINVRDVLHSSDVWSNEANASAILSEVM